MLHANFMAVCFIEPELLPIEVLHCGNREFLPVCSCDLDLDPMTFIYELGAVFRGDIPDVQFLRQGFRKLSSDRQTDRHTYRHDRNNILGRLRVVKLFNYSVQNINNMEIINRCRHAFCFYSLLLAP